MKASSSPTDIGTFFWGFSDGPSWGRCPCLGGAARPWLAVGLCGECAPVVPARAGLRPAEPHGVIELEGSLKRRPCSFRGAPPPRPSGLAVGPPRGRRGGSGLGYTLVSYRRGTGGALPGVCQPESLPTAESLLGPTVGTAHLQAPRHHFCLPQVWRGTEHALRTRSARPLSSLQPWLAGGSELQGNVPAKGGLV